MQIKLSDLITTTLSVIKSYGYGDTESEVIKDILLYAQLRGNNQGIVKLIDAGIPKRLDSLAPVIEKESAVSALVKGNRTHSMVVMNLLTELAIKKALTSGIGITGNYDTDESTGALGYYVEKIAKEGLIGIAFASAPFQTTAPYGSNEARYCTNPMAYGIPTQTNPIILDMSTSAMAYYGLIEAKTAGRSVSQGIGYDKEGNETTNPAEIMAGAIRSFGGHKGAGLALVVQILAGAFVKADSFNNDSVNAGNLIFAINPEIFLNKSDFTQNVSDIVVKVKSARKIAGVEEIYVPGERGNRFKNAVEKTGMIEVEENLWKQLLEKVSTN